MSHLETVDGVNRAHSDNQWVIVYDAVLGLLEARYNTSSLQTMSRYAMEVFGTEAAAMTRVSNLGYSWPEFD